MKVVKEISLIKEILNQARYDGKTIGFVPTMGFLHEGHLSLMEEARKENDILVVSIFVNPTQFGENEDLDIYPRDFEKDKKLSEKVGVDYIFFPEVEEIYPNGFNTYVNVENITNKLCGKSRPGHFRGVTTVVNKLFNIVKPHNAYFGQKDAQQLMVIKKMVRDLSMDINIKPCPIIREKDGLAMSSRNINLTKEDRLKSLGISKGLFQVIEKKSELKTSQDIIDIIRKSLKVHDIESIDYIEVLSLNELEEIKTLKGEVLVAIAVKVGKVRLIDNCILDF